MSSRPEYTAPPELFYNADEARKYTSNSRMLQIQQQISERCIELLNLPEGRQCFLLDVGCGSGLSGEQLSVSGHVWCGMDISKDMIDVAHEREAEGDLFVADMGQGAFFKPGTFDGVISVSALQWLCNADKRSHDPRKRLKCFFTTLYGCMAHGARAVFQFYPDTPQQMELIVNSALKSGFTGGVVIDFPNSTKAKKIYLCLFAGVVGNIPRAKAGETAGDAQAARYTRENRRHSKRGERVDPKSKQWILKKKEQRRKKNGANTVRPDTKFTGRKRPDKF